MAAGFGVKARRISKREDLRDGIREMLEADEPYLLEVIVPFTEHVMPMIPQGKSAKEILTD
jgi:acetolactate synthase-1/2/3 large subunit